MLHPIGWDAFGLPAEQYAIKTGQHPRITTETNVSNFKRQIQSLGFSDDWSREIDTTDPKYFRWTQWIFLQLYNSWFNPETNRADSIETLAYPDDATTEEQKRAWRDEHRLAYVSEAPVNWCPELGTVLANEEVKDGVSEVGGSRGTQADASVDAAHHRLRPAVAGRSRWHRVERFPQGNAAQLDRPIRGRGWSSRSKIPTRRSPVFTTRPDTLFGATYMVLSPEASCWTSRFARAKAEVEAYQAQAARKSDLERTDLAKDKTGVFTYAVNPANGRRCRSGRPTTCWPVTALAPSWLCQRDARP